MKMSRNTVKKYMRQDSPPQFSRVQGPKKTDPYVELIGDMEEQDYLGTRIFEEIKKHGYTGSQTGVYRELQRITQVQERIRQSTTRVETDPGEQMQYDWKEWDLPIGPGEIRIYIHQVVLSFSRKKYFTFSVTISHLDIIRALTEAVEFFGGSARKLVIDNPRQIITEHGADGVVRYTDALLKFAGSYGLELSPCQPRRPRTKGKVERPFYYVQEHFLRGLHVMNLTEFEAGLRQHMQEYNQREHSTLHEIPDNRFLREQGKLKTIRREEPIIFCEHEVRKVSNDGYIKYRGGYYPVSMEYCLDYVLVEGIMGRKIRIINQKGDLLKEYDVNLFENGLRPEHPEHKAMNESFQAKREEKRSSLVEKFETEFGAVGQQYVVGLKEQTRENVYWHIKQILHLSKFYDTGLIQEALQDAINCRSYHKNTIVSLLRLKKMKVLAPNAEIALVSIVLPPSGLSDAPVNIRRGLECYAILNPGGR
jgi:transposase